MKTLLILSLIVLSLNSFADPAKDGAGQKNPKKSLDPWSDDYDDKKDGNAALAGCEVSNDYEKITCPFGVYDRTSGTLDSPKPGLKIPEHTPGEKLPFSQNKKAEQL